MQTATPETPARTVTYSFTAWFTTRTRAPRTGLTGHAGLFSTADDLTLFATELLRGLAGDKRHLPGPSPRGLHDAAATCSPTPVAPSAGA